jgi:DMSO/TMAO reductase YedYZ molybdopterin-dependent catalytic subunit
LAKFVWRFLFASDRLGGADAGMSNLPRATSRRAEPVASSHGLLSCTQWTGVPVSVLLDEAGSDPAAKWVLFEGADG